MTHRTVETLIGRLVADEGLRALFRENPYAVVARLRREGAELNAIEADALASLDPDALARLAKSLDARLQRASLAPRTRARVGPLLLYVLLAFGASAANAAPPVERAALPWHPALRPALPLPVSALGWTASPPANAARAAVPASTFGWHRESAAHGAPVGLLTFPLRRTSRSTP